MEKKILGNTGIEVSVIGFGVLTIGKTHLNLSVEEGAELLKYAFSKGINFLDTAQYYQTSHYIKKALTSSNFEPIISSKSLCNSKKDMEAAIEQARTELNRDVIDIFLLHELRTEKDWQTRQGAWEALQNAKVKGIIKASGISTHHVDMAELVSDVSECDVLFPLINFRSLGIRNGEYAGSKQEMEAAILKNHQKGKGTYAMKVFGGGNLTGHYLEALDYVSGLKGISSIMVGFGNTEEIDRICQYADGTIDRSYRPDISNKKIHINQSDCEGCGACIKRCPNHAISYNQKGLAEINEKKCITCGYCAPQCPVRAIIMY